MTVKIGTHLYITPLSSQIKDAGGTGYNADVEKVETGALPGHTIAYRFKGEYNQEITLKIPDEICVATISCSVGRQYIYFDAENNRVVLVDVRDRRLHEKVTLCAAKACPTTGAISFNKQLAEKLATDILAPTGKAYVKWSEYVQIDCEVNSQ